MRLCNQKCAFRPTPAIVFQAQRFRRFCARHAVFGFVRVNDFSGFGSSNVGFVPRRPMFSVPTLTFMRASNVLRSASELMHVLGLGVWMLAPSAASRHRTLPGWQRCMLAPSNASRNRTLPGWQRWMLDPSDASRNRTLPGWQRWMLAPSDASRKRTVGSDGCPPHRF